MKKLLLAVDIGSTSIKAILFEENGNIAASSKRPTPFITDPEGVCYSTQIIWERTADAIAETVSKCNDEIAAVSVTGFGNDGVPLDKDGQEVYPFISWKCTRMVPQFERFIERFGKERMFMATGAQPRPVDAVYKLMWLYENHPGRMDSMENWLMVEDYINYKLCGEMVSDHTVAFTTGLYDPAAEKWSREVADAAGLPLKMMPDVKPSGTVIGAITSEAARRTGIKEGTPVVLGGWDITCSSFAVGAFRDGTVMDIMGTWETIMVSSGEYLRTKEVYDLGLNACHHVAQGKYAYPVYFVSAAMVEWFLDVYYSKREDTITDNAYYESFIADVLKAAAGCNGTMFLPNLYGSAAPVVDGRSRGAFVGLTHKTGRPEMARALLEGLSFICRQVLEGCEAFMDSDLYKIIVCGGGMRNKAWCKIKADLTGKDIMLSSIEETTALGAALKAGVGTGVYSSDEQAIEAIHADSTHLECDRETTKIYDRLYPLFSRLYSDLNHINRALWDIGV